QDPRQANATKLDTQEVEVTLSPRDPIQGNASINIDPEKYGEIPQAGSGSGSSSVPPDNKKKLKQGIWYFVARVPPDPREICPEAEHSTRQRPTEVRVVDKPLTVLLFAGAPTHDYQYLRSMLVREKDRGRVDLSIYIQPAPGLDAPRNGITQDVEADRL